jgi:hemerythrin-like domain-containing protein
MPVQIGTQEKGSFREDPLALLSDCHRRVEHFLRALLAVAGRAEGRALDAEERDALQRALRYFREAAPKHTQDEEQSLFPRMRQLGGLEIEGAMQRIDALEADHITAAAQHQIVEDLGNKWLAAPLAAGEFRRFRAALELLHELYRRHIEVEDTDIFPLAKRALSPEIQREVGREMAARRQVQKFEP